MRWMQNIDENYTKYIWISYKNSNVFDIYITKYMQYIWNKILIYIKENVIVHKICMVFEWILLKIQFLAIKAVNVKDSL